MSSPSDKSGISAYELLKSGGRASVGTLPSDPPDPFDPFDKLRVSGVVSGDERGSDCERELEEGGTTPGRSFEEEGGRFCAALGTLPDGAPVGEGAPPSPPAAPPKAPGHPHWTRARMVEFLRELAACQSVARAAKAVGMSRQSAYRLRNRLQGTPFSLGWEVALEAGLQQLAHAVMDRAVNGVEVPVYYHGERVGARRHFDERLAIWVLENPWKVGRHQIAREYSGEAFDALLERIEWAGFDWEEGEAVPGPGAPAGTPDDVAQRCEDLFTQKRSWYVSQVEGEDRARRR